MEKIIRVKEYEFPAKSTAASLFSYKSNFGRDGLRDLISLAGSVSGMSEDTPENVMLSENFSLDVFFRFLWVFAKAANRDIPPIEEWLSEFDVLPIDFAVEVLPQISDMLASTAHSTVKAKNFQAAAKAK